MKLIKKRINSISSLTILENNEKIIIALKDATRFKEKLIDLGFSENLEEGERILPKVVNPTTERNAEIFYVSDKTSPKEEYLQTVWWTRQEWAGRNITREVSSYVYIPRRRYPRIEFEPYGVELTLKYDINNNLMVTTDVLNLQDKSTKFILNTFNIFFTNFGECDILVDDFDDLLLHRDIKYLNWELLPKGNIPWEVIKKKIGHYKKKYSETKKHILFDKSNYIIQFDPDLIAFGKAGFNGYIVFGFSDINLFVLESIYYGNATYILTNDWENLTKLTKAELINENLVQYRLIHNENWKQEFSKIIKTKLQK
jgi:hypothetical protein